MNLPFKRSKSKKAKAADVLGSVAKLWSELQIAKRASKGVKEGTKKAASAKDAAGSRAGTTPAKAVGAIALLGGAGALIAKKLKGGEPETAYVPPPPAASEPGDMRPALVPQPAADEPRVVVEDAPIVLEDLAGQDAEDEQPAAEEESAGDESDSDQTDSDESDDETPASPA